MSSFRATAYSAVDTTGEQVSAGNYGGNPSPNEVLLTADAAILVGGAAADAVFPIAADVIVPINMIASDTLWVKAASGTANVYVLETKAD